MSGLIIPNAPPKTCGNCTWFEGMASDLQMGECTSLPPTPQIIGGEQTVRGPSFQIQHIRPNVPRAMKACSLFERKAAE